MNGNDTGPPCSDIEVSVPFVFCCMVSMAALVGGLVCLNMTGASRWRGHRQVVPRS